MTDSLGKLPKEAVDRITRPFTRFLRIEAMAGAVLLFCTAIALGLSNSPWSDAFLTFWETPAGIEVGTFDYARSLRHWINDGLMTLLFFVVALELKREMVLGELRDLRVAALSLAGALGGMALPAALFILVEAGGRAAHGWGTVMATDTAFVIGGLAVLGARIPLNLRLFLLSLAIFDDIGAILVVAIGYGGTLNAYALGMAGMGLGLIAGMARFGIRSIPAYFAVGVPIWLAVDLSGLHPTLVGVALGLMTPARSWVSDNRLHAILSRVTAYPPGDHWSGDTTDRADLRRAGVAATEALSPIERLEIILHPLVAFAVVPLFALANAGTVLGGVTIDLSLALAIFLGFVVGKPLGILAFSAVAVGLRLATRPADLPWRLIAAGAMLAGIGFTMALFIADLAFGGDLLVTAKISILAASCVSGVASLSALAWLTRIPALEADSRAPPS
ncbi:Na+/H+ antiporter NhaA [Zavarzinia sp.]|uniref:Na+/H+ antiporter NhaA n=1 Tax=Zavarzinia sp. TaxID=2027920 RepID=UPI00356A90EC